MYVAEQVNVWCDRLNVQRWITKYGNASYWVYNTDVRNVHKQCKMQCKCKNLKNIPVKQTNEAESKKEISICKEPEINLEV